MDAASRADSTRRVALHPEAYAAERQWSVEHRAKTVLGAFAAGLATYVLGPMLSVTVRGSGQAVKGLVGVVPFAGLLWAGSLHRTPSPAAGCTAPDAVATDTRAGSLAHCGRLHQTIGGCAIHFTIIRAVHTATKSVPLNCICGVARVRWQSTHRFGSAIQTHPVVCCHSTCYALLRHRRTVGRVPTPMERADPHGHPPRPL